MIEVSYDVDPTKFILFRALRVRIWEESEHAGTSIEVNKKLLKHVWTFVYSFLQDAFYDSRVILLVILSEQNSLKSNDKLIVSGAD